MSNAVPSGVERIKEASRGLRGEISADLASGGSQVGEAVYHLLKFHGTYEQYDRDTATALKQSGQEKDYSFMVRVRIPGGRLSARQYLFLDRLADTHANGTLRITTRQTIQFHCVAKDDLKAAIAGVDKALLTTFATCGDVVRNVVTTSRPVRDAVHSRLQADAAMLSAALLPRTRAHHEIFLDGEPVAGAEEEPLYGPTYLPRKFKIAIATADDNTPDVLSNDLGIVARFDGGAPVGYDLCLGGGQGMTHNRAATYPRLATPIASVGPDDLLRGVEAVVRLQRDHGDRSDRRHARLKYVVEEKGAQWTRRVLEEQFGGPMADPAPLPRFGMPEVLGWHEQGDGRLWLGVPVPSGRIADAGAVRLRSALRLLLDGLVPAAVLTPQQDILLCDVAPADRAEIDRVLDAHGVRRASRLAPVERWSLACVALPTCGLALAEAERVQAPLLEQVVAALSRHGLEEERISLRVTGCPNGCARPYTGDIGIVGRAPGTYALFVGGDFEGTRLNAKLTDRLPEEAVVPTLDRLFGGFAADRAPGEGFGDWCHRVGRDALLVRAGLETA